MGDLSGGRILMKRAQKSLALKGDGGSAFYIFEVRCVITLIATRKQTTKTTINDNDKATTTTTTTTN